MMTSSKYGNLPDIDTESPEVFESPDVVLEEPDVEREAELMDDEFQDSFRDGIEQESTLSVSGAAKIFRQKERQVQQLGISSFTTKGRGETLFSSETRAQKLNRLSLELYELKKDMEEETESGGSKTMESIKAQLSSLDATLSALSEAQCSSDSLSIKSLINGLTKSTIQTPSSMPSAVVKGALSHQKQTFSCNPRNLDLESRVETLEKIVGASFDQAYMQLPSGDILSSLYKMEHQLRLLSDPETQTRLITRFKELNALLSKNPAAFVADDKINTLYKTLDLPTLKSIPMILRRLVDLKDVHSTAASMVERLQGLESRINSDGQSTLEAQQALETLKRTMTTNNERIQVNLEILADRMESLNARIVKLPTSV